MLTGLMFLIGAAGFGLLWGLVELINHSEGGAS